MTASSTIQLWTALRAGSEEAYAVIYKQHFFYLLNFGRKITDNRELVRDAIQDLFLELWNNRARLADVSSVKYYLATALKYKLYRSLGRSSLLSETNEELIISREEEWIQEEISREHCARIHEALLRLLTPRQREAVHLKFFHSLDNDEIASAMQISKEAVYNSISKALRVLRKNTDRAILGLGILLSYLQQ